MVPVVLRKVLEIKQKTIPLPGHCFYLLVSLAQLASLFHLSLHLSVLSFAGSPSLLLPPPACLPASSSRLPPEELKKPDLSSSQASQQ